MNTNTDAAVLDLLADVAIALENLTVAFNASCIRPNETSEGYRQRLFSELEAATSAASEAIVRFERTRRFNMAWKQLEDKKGCEIK